MKYDEQQILNGIGWIALICLAMPAIAQGQNRNSRIPPDLRTGPETGETIPSIAAIDQHGNRRDFADIVGPNGAMILFVASIPRIEHGNRFGSALPDMR